MIAAAALPPARMPLRDDVRSRLGWGLVYEVLPLADEDKPLALATYARSRGFALADDVVAYLLAHGRRDMTSLMATLAALDRHSLASKRPITTPLLKEWLQRGLGFSRRRPGTGRASPEFVAKRRHCRCGGGSVNSLIAQLKCWVVPCLGRRERCQPA